MAFVLVGLEHSWYIYSVIFIRPVQSGNFLGRVSMAGINTVTDNSFFPQQKNLR